ncbi:MAG: hypothetical protein N2323_04675 [candidate division WOR-3 bacterium]|nr:hypothetical protein [candidate division WOR-3 bacterium]MCX7837236.1 hypothetical protein [candidate division WOR-3 bacterium]MDW8113429.1 hypothetical protein [candidate division WOR-3 bacterium]
MKKLLIILSCFIFLLPLISFSQKILKEKDIQKIITTEFKDAQIEKLEKKQEDNNIFYYGNIIFENKKFSLKIDGKTGKIIEKKEVLTPIDIKAMELAKTILDGEIINWSKEVDEGEATYYFEMKDNKGITKYIEINISWEVGEEE